MIKKIFLGLVFRSNSLPRKKKYPRQACLPEDSCILTIISHQKVFLTSNRQLTQGFSNQHSRSTQLELQVDVYVRIQFGTWFSLALMLFDVAHSLAERTYHIVKVLRIQKQFVLLKPY